MRIKLFRGITLTPRLSMMMISVLFKIIGIAFLWIALAAKNPVLGIASIIVCLFWFAILFLVIIPSTDARFSKHFRWLDRVAKISLVVLVIIGILEILSIAVIPRFVLSKTGNSQSNWINSFARIPVYGDATALNQQATDNLLKAENPYKEANVIKAGIEFDVPSDKLTPLRAGHFTNDFPYPSLDKMEEIYVKAQVTPDKIPPEFESRYNYPAASFILPAPFIAMGIHDMRIIFLLFLVPAFGYVIWQIKSNKLRLFFIAMLIASLELWSSIFSGSTSLLVIPFLMLAWIFYRKNLWLSALFIGIALAVKQIAWFLFPFYVILILREKGVARALLISAITGGIFLLFNIPYLLPDPGLWLRSVLAPMGNDLFPSNILVLVLNFTGVLHIESSLPFTIAELIVLVVATIWYYRNCRRLPETALVLVVLPFFFAWRGSWSYLFFFDFIIFATILIYEYKDKGEEFILRDTVSKP